MKINKTQPKVKTLPSDVIKLYWQAMTWKWHAHNLLNLISLSFTHWLLESFSSKTATKLRSAESIKSKIEQMLRNVLRNKQHELVKLPGVVLPWASWWQSTNTLIITAHANFKNSRYHVTFTMFYKRNTLAITNTV